MTAAIGAPTMRYAGGRRVAHASSALPAIVASHADGKRRGSDAHYNRSVRIVLAIVASCMLLVPS